MSAPDNAHVLTKDSSCQTGVYTWCTDADIKSSLHFFGAESHVNGHLHLGRRASGAFTGNKALQLAD
jgi:hypothetical protein